MSRVSVVGVLASQQEVMSPPKDDSLPARLPAQLPAQLPMEPLQAVPHPDLQGECNHPLTGGPLYACSTLLHG